jgi:hypothetical protein
MRLNLSLSLMNVVLAVLIAITFGYIMVGHPTEAVAGCGPYDCHDLCLNVPDPQWADCDLNCCAYDCGIDTCGTDYNHCIADCVG